WGEHTVSLPPGPWREVLGGVPVDGGACPLADLLAHRPVALLVRWPGSGDPPPSTSLYTPLTGP
ncbi:MAG: hypothetical protein WAL50_02675, partial [Kineosporiaceae bacterium]